MLAKGKALTSTKIRTLKSGNKDDDKCSHKTYCIESGDSAMKQNSKGVKKSSHKNNIISESDKQNRHHRSQCDRKTHHINIEYSGKQTLSKTHKKSVEKSPAQQLSPLSFYSETFNSNHDINEEQVQFFSQSKNSSCIDLEIDLVVRLLTTLINSRQLNDKNRRQIMQYVVRHISRLSAGGGASNKMNNIDLSLKKTSGGYQIRNTSSDSSIAQLYRVQNLRPCSGERQQSASTQALPGSKVIENNGSNEENEAPQASTSSKKVYPKICSDTSISNECIVEVKGLKKLQIYCLFSLYVFILCIVLIFLFLVYKKPEQKIQVEKKKRKKKKVEQKYAVDKEDEEYVEEEDIFYTSQELDTQIEITCEENTRTENNKNDTEGQNKSDSTTLISTKNKKETTSGNMCESTIKIDVETDEKQDPTTSQQEKAKENQNIRRSGGCNTLLKDCLQNKNKKRDAENVPSNPSLMNRFPLSSFSITSSSSIERGRLVQQDWLYPLTKSEIAYEIDALKKSRNCKLKKCTNTLCNCDNNDNDNDTCDMTDNRLNYVEDKIRYLQSLKQLLLQEQTQQHWDRSNYNQQQRNQYPPKRNYTLIKGKDKRKGLAEKRSEVIEKSVQYTHPSLQNSSENCLDATSSVYHNVNSDICNDIHANEDIHTKEISENNSFTEIQIANVQMNEDNLQEIESKSPESMRDDRIKISQSFVGAYEEEQQNIEMKDKIIDNKIENEHTKSPTKEKAFKQSVQGVNDKSKDDILTENQTHRSNYKQMDFYNDNNKALDKDNESTNGLTSINFQGEEKIKWKTDGLQDSDMKNNVNTLTYKKLPRAEVNKIYRKQAKMFSSTKDLINFSHNKHLHEMNIYSGSKIVCAEGDDEGSLNELCLEIPIEFESDAVEYFDDEAIFEENGDKIYFSSLERMTAMDTPSLSGSGDDYDFNYLIQQRTNHFMKLYHKKEMELFRLQQLHRQYEQRILKHKFNSAKDSRICPLARGRGGEDKNEVGNFYLNKKPQLTMTAAAMTTTNTTTTTTSSASVFYMSSEILDQDKLANGETYSGTSKNAMKLEKIEIDRNGRQRQCLHDRQAQQQKQLKTRRQIPKHQQRRLQRTNNEFVDKRHSKNEKLPTSNGSASILSSEKRIPVTVTSSVNSTETHLPRSIYSLSEQSIRIKPKSIAFAVPLVDTPNDFTKNRRKVDRNVLKREKGKQHTVNPNADYADLKNSKFLTLQESLAQAKPQFLKESQHRKKLLTTMQKIRTKRQRCIREFIDQINSNNDYSSSNYYKDRCNEIENGGSSNSDNKEGTEYYRITIPPPATSE